MSAAYVADMDTCTENHGSTTNAPGAGNKRRKNRERQRQRQRQQQKKMVEVSGVTDVKLIEEPTTTTTTATTVETFQLQLHNPLTPSQVLEAEKQVVTSWASRLELRRAKQKRVAEDNPLFLESTTHESVLLSLFLKEVLASPRNRSLEKVVQDCIKRCGGDEAMARWERDRAIDELRQLVPVDQEVVLYHLLADTSIPLSESKTVFSYTITRRSDMVPISLRQFHKAGLQKVPSQSPGVVSNVVEPELLKDYQTLGSMKVSQPRFGMTHHFHTKQLPVFGATQVDRGGLEECTSSLATCRDNEGQSVTLTFASPGSALAFETLYVDQKTGFVPSVATPEEKEKLSQDLSLLFGGETPIVIHTDDLGFEQGVKDRVPGSRSKEFQKRAERQLRDRLEKVVRDRRILSQFMAEGTRHIITLNIHGHFTLPILADLYVTSKVFQTMLLMRSKAVARNDPSLILVLTDPFISMEDLEVGPQEKCSSLDFNGKVTTAYGKKVDGLVKELWMATRK